MPLHGQTFSSSLNTVAILAPGLIGGSLALALRQQQGWETRIWARDDASLRKADAMLHPNRASRELEEIIPGARIAVLCTPVSVMGRLARRIQPLLDSNAVVTDVGSVKTMVMCELVPLLGDRFVGGHPMAGSERSGLEAARMDLFANAPCILTPTRSTETSTACVQLVRSLWTSVGARTVEMTPQAHDTAVALISHLPHAIAAALVKTVCLQDVSLQEFAGGGYRDTTRIAQGSPDLWVDIFLENREPVLKALSEYRDQFQTFIRLLQATNVAELRAFLEEASTARALINHAQG